MIEITLQNLIDNHLKDIITNSLWLKLLSTAITVSLIFIIAFMVYIVLRLMTNFVTSRINKDIYFVFIKALIAGNGFNFIAHLGAASVLWIGSQFAIRHDNIFYSRISLGINKVALFYLFITLLLLITRIIKAINAYYESKYPFAKEYPIYSYLNVVVFFVWIIGIILIIAYFSQRSPLVLLTSVGAVSAIFLLVFKDTLLGIVSSIQASASNIVKIGDRISIAKYGIDGEVTNISINVVRIKNEDNTIATIPTYMLTSETVKNWRNVSKASEIQKSFYIDIETVALCSKAQQQKLSDELLGIREYTEKYSSHRFTNLELYRIHLEAYLKHNPNINSNKDVLVHLLAPTNYGVPIELKAVTYHVAKYNHAHVQSQILEYSFVTLGYFGLKTKQQ